MPRLLYALEDYFDAEAAEHKGSVLCHLMHGASVLFAIAGDAMNPQKSLRSLFPLEH